MAPNSLKSELLLAHGVATSAASVARRRAAANHGSHAVANKPDALLGAIAVRQLFHRWPLVPSRELERIRHVLLHCDQLGSPDTHHLSEPAQALLELINCELERRRNAAAPQRTPEAKMPANAPQRGAA
ncbi:hypothetical protein [Paenarthrobacter aurescens]|uniref:Uncharacterized protein n=1 Tax=Paenarthrobacter aurescens TaxID=43663 RepID=A0A4Y3NDB3_PAEAU|nr:hypothetical protein [Paenarthrobacter aurescens]MDO6142020.1 hypothetical protein [Paenarthrobacter aurescens]MDO6145825.1 hypothetical protein [Paenarthrobacter aurescens]MDO6157069.1 hypothetical protein [Paenarthrobacter aurescens]MDO6161055.1 hypothetical protein [Paenarthrobacter aurescens]GEB19233.1 hypothetical protein AAU01_19880 [Paenarthrobacter aurescens]